MDLKESKVVLTIKLEGCSKPGLTKNTSDCTKHITLGEQFILHAVSNEGRPSSHESMFHASKWKRMPKLNRLDYHVRKLAEFHANRTNLVKNEDYSYVLLN